MSKSPSQRKMCNPCGIPDAEYFGHRKTRLKRTRTEPLPGTKVLLPSENNEGLKELLLSQTRQTEPCTTSKSMGWVAIGLSVIMLLISYVGLFIGLPEFLGMVYFLSFIVMHVCVLCSQLMSDGRDGLGLLSLAIYYPGLLLWFIIVSFCLTTSERI